MDRGTVLLHSLRDNLRPWADRIRRATYASSVTFIPHKDGEFAVRIEWKVGDETRHFERAFRRLEVFGKSFNDGPAGWRIQLKTCDYAKLLMREAMAARGL
jgi:hypothetical protein